LLACFSQLVAKLQGAERGHLRKSHSGTSTFRFDKRKIESDIVTNDNRSPHVAQYVAHYFFELGRMHYIARTKAMEASWSKISSRIYKRDNFRAMAIGREPANCDFDDPVEFACKQTGRLNVNNRVSKLIESTHMRAMAPYRSAIPNE